MKIAAIYSIVALSIAPALASTDDSVSLLIIGSSGAVIAVDGMTQRECDAATSLLNNRDKNSIAPPGVQLWNGYNSLTLGDPPPPKTPSVASAKCMKASGSK